MKRLLLGIMLLALAPVAGAQAYRTVLKGDSALLIMKHSCTTGCPDSIRFNRKYGDNRRSRVLPAKATDTMRVKRGLTGAVSDSAWFTPYKSTLKVTVVPQMPVDTVFEWALSNGTITRTPEIPEGDSIRGVLYLKLYNGMKIRPAIQPNWASRDTTIVTLRYQNALRDTVWFISKK